MTKKMPLTPDMQPLHPQFSYRVNSPTAIAVIGLGPSQQKVAIENGELPEPMSLTPSGRARAWLGQQLIDIQKQRLAIAEAIAAERRAKQQEEQTSAKPRGHPRKVA